jgi:hypothetical protein
MKQWDFNFRKGIGLHGLLRQNFLRNLRRVEGRPHFFGLELTGTVTAQPG